MSPAYSKADRRRLPLKIDGQLRESRTRDVREIAWILMFADCLSDN